MPDIQRFLSAVVLGVVVATAIGSSAVAQTLPPSGTTTLDVAGSVSITSRTGTETVSLSGTATIVNAGPHDKSGVDADAAELTSLSLAGNSVTGPVTVTESTARVSDGEIRSIGGDSFPATSYFNVYAIVTVPAAPSPSITLYNDVPLVMTDSSVGTWPPQLETFSATPSPSILLEPSIQNPAQIRVTSATFSLAGVPVGGVSRLAEPVEREHRVEETTFNDHAVGVMVVLGLLAIAGAAGNYARARLRSSP
jgi:hypothetical protein